MCACVRACVRACVCVCVSYCSAEGVRMRHADNISVQSDARRTEAEKEPGLAKRGSRAKARKDNVV